MPPAAHLNPLSIAPMVDRTDRHCRMLLRLIAPKATLYTEMIVDRAVLFGNISKVLGYSYAEQPLIAQVAGREPNLLVEAAQIIEEQRFAAVNLNVGCPSKRVKNGGFGACLMEESPRLFQIVTSMKNAVKIPVTVKCRIGTDKVGGFDWLSDFVSGLAEAGVDGVVIHARVALLNGVSTSYNLNVPPLDWDMVRRIQEKFPDLPITLNGGINSEQEAHKALTKADQIMVGRLALNRPDLLANIHASIYKSDANFTPMDVALEYRKYVKDSLDHGVPFRALTRHMLSLFHGWHGAKRYRQMLSGFGAEINPGIELIDEALACLQERNRTVRNVVPQSLVA